MNKRIFDLVFCSLIILILILSIYFVLANSTITNVHFEGNVTPYYDEGVFTINWTAAGDATSNYTIYLWMNNVYVSNTQNTSVTNYTRSDITEANYTFTIQAANYTNVKTNYTNVSMYVDRTAPVIALPSYTNATPKQNTATLTLNISVIDAHSGETGSICLIDVNGTSNQSVAVDANGWCNSSFINLTGSADGNHSINIYVNDTVNNVGLNNSYTVQVDTTAPVPVFSCSPLSVYQSQLISCSCSATDATSGVLSTTFTTNPSTSGTGTFVTHCNVSDVAGNWGNSSTTYTVGWKQAGVQGSATTFFWEKSYVITEEQFAEGYTKPLAVNSRIKIRIKNIEHHVGIKEMTQDSATIEIASEPVEVILNVGKEAKVDITGNGYYDIYVLLNSILNNEANVTIQEISEEILEEESVSISGEGEGVDDEGKGGEVEEKEKNYWWIWIIVIVVLIIVGVGWKKYSK